MRNLAFAMLATAGFVGTPVFAAISPTGNPTNDTQQIQAAIDAAPNGTVTLSAGTYSIIRAITISNGASLIGGGSAPGEVVLSLATKTLADGDCNVIKIENSANTVISNLTVTTGAAVQGNNPGFGPKSGINMDSGLVVDCEIRDCKTRNNTYAGGGVNMSGGTMRRCLVVGCNALDSGGAGQRGEGIYMEGGLVENCTVVSNGSTNASYMGYASSGGAVYVKNGVLRNCLIANNWNRVGASGVTARENATVENCTIVGNKQNCAEAVAKGVDLSGSGIAFRNNIVWGNTAYDGSLANFNIADNVGSDAFMYSDTKPLVVGTGNISVDPEFVDAVNGDYHTGYSYCSDAGQNQIWMREAFDLDGNERVRNTIVDMGCYESAPPVGFTCRMSLTSNEMPNLSTVFLECGCNEGTLDTAEWTFTRAEDGAQATANGTSTSVELGSGTWDVQLFAARGQQSTTLSRQGIVVVQSTIVYANEKGRGEFPYDTVERGLPSINEALQALSAGGTLYVAAGDYVISNGINLVEGRGTRIVSLSGPESTIVRLSNVAAFNNGSNGGDYGLRLSCDSAYVSGLTFVAGRKGPYYDGDEYNSLGLVKVANGGAVLTNCVFRDLKCLDRVWGTGLSISAGTVVDCLFTCIDSFSSSGATPQGGVIRIEGGLVDRTRIVDCLARDSTYSTSATHSGGQGDVVGVWGSGVLRNSLVTRCASQHDTPIYVGAASGASVGGHLENCTIVANTNLQAVAKEGFWYAGAVIVNGGSITNCIVVDNWSVLGGAVSNIYNTAGANGIGYTLVNDRTGDSTFATAENHNLAVQPGTQVFRRPEVGNYTLSGRSPAVNAGLLLDWMATSIDLAGSPRVISRVPDLGCYEAAPQGFAIRLR